MTEDKMVGWHHGLDGCEFAVHAGTKSQTWLSDWTEGRKKTRVLIPVLPLIMWWWSESVSHSVVSDYEPMDCSSTGFSVHGILQARILEWVAIPFSSWSFQARDWIWVSCTAGSLFAIWATREALQRQDIEKQLQGEEHWLGWGPRTSHHLPVSVAASEGPLLKWGLHWARPS